MQMGANPRLSTIRQEATRQLILEAGFRLFSEHSIERITMTDVANAAGIGVATVYRYFNTKQTLVLATGTWVWEKYLADALRFLDTQNLTAAGRFEYFLNVFLSMYRSHRNVLRFNQFFNVYLGKEGGISEEAGKPYVSMLEGVLLPRFEEMLCKAGEDRSMRTDVPAKEIMLVSLHLMLAAVTRYAVGLVYTGGCDPEKELILLRDMLMDRFTTKDKTGDT